MSFFARFLDRKPQLKLLSPVEFADRITEQKHTLLEIFLKRVRTEVAGAKGESRTYLIDHLPQVLDEMSQYLRSLGSNRDYLESVWLASKHGIERAEGLRYTLEDLRQEYVILREIIAELLSENEILSKDASYFFGRVFDISLSRATEVFVRNSASELLEHAAQRKDSAQRLATSRIEMTDSQNQQKWFLEAIEKIPVALFFLDYETRLVSYSNEFAKKMLGFNYQHTDPQEVIGKKFRAYDLAGVELRLEQLPSQRAFRGEMVQGEEFILETPSGRFHVKVYSQYLPASHGQPASAVLVYQDITAAKSTEHELKKTKDELSQAIEIAQVGFFFLELDTPRLAVTPILLKQYGISPATFRETLDEAFEAIHPADRARVSKALGYAIDNNLPYHDEYRVLHSNGAVHWVEAKGGTIVDARSGLRRFTGTTLDITEKIHARDRLEQAKRDLEAEQQKFRTIFADSATSMAVLQGPTFIYEIANKSYLELFNNRDIIGKPFLEALPELEGQAFPLIAQKVFATGEPYIDREAQAYLQRTADGPLEERYFDQTYTRMLDERGEPYGVFIHAREVTDLVFARRQIEETAERLRLAIDVGNMGTWELDVKTNLVKWSKRASEIFDVEGLQGIPLERILEHIHPDDVQMVRQEIGQATDPNGTGDYAVDYRVRQRDGTVRWLSLLGKSFFADTPEGRTATLFTGMVIDITDRVLAETALKEAKDRAEMANAAKSQFLANMSHEIRTPLGAIMGFASLLKDQSMGREEQEGFLSVIDRNSSQLLRIIDDILDLSKVEAGMMLIENIEFSLPEMLTDFASLLGFRAREKGIGFISRAVTPLPKIVSGDPTRLRQILINVVGNAIKFTDRGHVEMRVCYSDGRLDIEVEDTGRGISREQEAHLFQPFAQADSSTTRKYGGTGLGLVLTRSLSEAMGGSFVLKKSELGKGSTFSICIQAQTAPNVEFVTGLGYETVPARSVLSVGQLAHLNILLVEDSPDNQALISIFLGRAGARTDIASDGEQGFRMALAGKYDVVLMDVQMPVMDGITAIKRLRAEGFTTPVIALTAHAMKEERIRCLDAGFTDFISKPVNRADLIEIILRNKRPVLEPVT